MGLGLADPAETANRTAKAIRVWDFIRTNAPEYARPSVLRCVDDVEWARIAAMAGETRTALSRATQAAIITLAEQTR